MALRYSTAIATQPNAVWVGGTRATLGASATTLNDGEWFWAANVLYLRSDAGNPDTLSLVIEAGQRANCIDSASKNTLTLSALRLQYANGLEAGNGGGVYLHFNPVAITLAGCEIQDNWSYGVICNGSIAGITITDSTIARNGLNGFYNNNPPATLVSILRTTFDGNGYRPLPSSGRASGLLGYFFSGEIASCTFTNNGLGGVAANGTEHGCYMNVAATSTMVVHHNMFSGHTSGSGLKMRCPATAHHNVFLGNKYGVALGNNGADNITYLLHHNVYAGSVTAGIYEQGKGAGTITLSVLNETLSVNSGVAGGYEVKIEDDLAATLTITNCLFVASDTRFTVGLIVAQSGTVAIDYNLHWRADGAPPLALANVTSTFAQWQAAGYDTHGLVADPRFVSGVDLSLAASSPAVNAGVPIAGITDGYNGSAPDLGASERAQGHRAQNFSFFLDD